MSDLNKGGRPPFVPTPELQQRVAIGAAAGMPHEDIAAALGICRNTLEKHFGHELSMGALQKRLDVLEAVYEQAVKGNVAAAKAFNQLVPRVIPPAETEPLPEGIKAQRDLAAKTAQEGTEWKRLGIQ